MEHRIVCAGFGGQGIMLMGQLLAHATLLRGFQTVWLPTYGPETRGGTANCSVIISPEPIDSPIVSGDATLLLVMNEPSLERFEKDLVPGGVLFLNQSLIRRPVRRQDIAVHAVPATELAIQAGAPQTANMVMLGALLEAQPIFPESLLADLVRQKLGPAKQHLVAVNQEALRLGAQAIRQARG